MLIYTIFLAKNQDDHGHLISSNAQNHRDYKRTESALRDKLNKSNGGGGGGGGGGANLDPG